MVSTIKNDDELAAARQRIEYFQQLLTQIRKTASPANFDAMAGGYRLEIERMQAEVMDYLLRPVDRVNEAQPVL